MFKYILFLCMFNFYNTGLQAMRPDSPKAATSPAAPPAAAVVPADDLAIAAITAGLSQFELVGEAAPLTRAEQTARRPKIEQAARQSIIKEPQNPRHNFEEFMTHLGMYCQSQHVLFKNVCSRSVAGQPSLVDSAIQAGCPVTTIQTLAQYGSPVNYIDSEHVTNSTLETAWRVDKNPDQKKIIKWLIETNPQQPKITMTSNIRAFTPSGKESALIILPQNACFLRLVLIILIENTHHVICIRQHKLL